MPLSQLLSDHRVIVCVGSGGVGKTTTSAALAMRAACEGRRVLCLTIDPARRLANSLGLEALRTEEQVVDASFFEQQGVRCEGHLSAMMLDMKTTFDGLVERYSKSAAQRKRILKNRIYQYVSTSLAGTQEYMAMEKLHAVRGDDRFDLIVLDTPPTTNALDFLEAPQRLVGAIDSPVMRWFAEALDGDAEGFGFVGKGTAFVLKGLARFTGADFLHLGREFISELNALFGGFRRRAEAVYEDLRGDDVAFIVVTSPTPATVAEAIYLGDRLADYGISPKGLVVNRVHQGVAELSPESVLSRKVAEEVGEARGPSLWEALASAAEDARLWAARDQEGIRRLCSRLRVPVHYAQVPAFDRDVHDLAGLRRVAVHFD